MLLANMLLKLIKTMKYLTKYLNLYDSFDSITKEKTDHNRFSYVYSKAYLLLEMGLEKFIKNDFFKLGHDYDWTTEEISNIEYACKQILEGKGLTESNPLQNIGITAFYQVFQLFHFDDVFRTTKRFKIENKIKFLDIIEFEHIVDSSRVTYCNLV